MKPRYCCRQCIVVMVCYSVHSPCAVCGVTILVHLRAGLVLPLLAHLRLPPVSMHAHLHAHVCHLQPSEPPTLQAHQTAARWLWRRGEMSVCVGWPSLLLAWQIARAHRSPADCISRMLWRATATPRSRRAVQRRSTEATAEEAGSPRRQSASADHALCPPFLMLACERPRLGWVFGAWWEQAGARH